MNKATATTEGTHGIVMSRVFNAPRDLIFKVMTDPQYVGQWWGRRDTTTRVDRMEPQPGGTWRYIEQDQEGNEFPFRGVYHELTAPERIVQTFEFEGMPGHVLLETMTLESQEDGSTKLSVSSVFQSTADRDGMFATDMEVGANESYDRLDELLATLMQLVA